MATLSFSRSKRLADLVSTHELRMQTLAAAYDLSTDRGRKQSAKALAELFFGLTRTLAPKLFIEAGAKDAATSMRARQLLPEAEIFAFEANPYNFARYSSSMRHADRRVNYIHKAIAHQSGTTSFKIRLLRQGEDVTPYTGTSSILERTADGELYEDVTVECARLDDLFPDAPTNALWVDVEGATSGVINGGRQVLKKTLVALVEMSDKCHWKGEWLASRVIRELMLLGLTPVARDFEYRTQYNVVFVHEEMLQTVEVRTNMIYFYGILAKKGC